MYCDRLTGAIATSSRPTMKHFIQKVTIQERLRVSHWMTSNTCIKMNRQLLLCYYLTQPRCFLAHFGRVVRQIPGICLVAAIAHLLLRKTIFLTPFGFVQKYVDVISMPLSYYLYKYQHIQVFAAFAENVQKKKQDIL